MPGRSRASGGCGGPCLGPPLRGPYANRGVEERHGCAGALPSVWGVWGAMSGPPTEEIPMPTLTIEQVKGIYLGDVKNWKEVGGKDAPIVIYSRENSSARTSS